MSWLLQILGHIAILWDQLMYLIKLSTTIYYLQTYTTIKVEMIDTSYIGGTQIHAYIYTNTVEQQQYNTIAT